MPGVANTIIRAPRRNRYLVLDQRIVDDTRLSWAARGMLAYLLSRPDNWEVRVTDLQRRGNLGRDGTYRLIGDLRSTGYVEFQQARDARGCIRGGSYIVREIPNPPHPESPDTDVVDWEFRERCRSHHGYIPARLWLVGIPHSLSIEGH